MYIDHTSLHLSRPATDLKEKIDYVQGRPTGRLWFGGLRGGPLKSHRTGRLAMTEGGCGFI